MLLEPGGYAWLGRLLGIALVAATLANGAGFYLKRTGVLQPDSYQAYWKVHCNGPQASERAPEPRCSTYPPAPVDPPQGATSRFPSERASADYVYTATGPEVALKLFKDALGAALVAVSACLIALRLAVLPGLREAWPIYLLFAYVSAAFALALFRFDALAAAAGLRPFMFLFIALLCRWLVPNLRFLAACAGLLLAIELLLVPYEMQAGIHLNGHLGNLPLAARAAGTLILPNSLGIFAVIAVAFYTCYSTNRAYLIPLGTISLLLVLASGSGTGFVCTLLFWYLLALEHSSGKKRAWVAYGGLAAVVVLLFALPAFVGRPGVTESIYVRLRSLYAIWSEKPAWGLVFGSGLGTNTNIALNLGKEAAEVAGAAGQAMPRNSDSTVISLLEQFGVAGIVLFYAMLFWAALKDRTSRIFYAVVGASSMTLNIPELFPINYLLGLGLAGSAWTARRTTSQRS